MTKKKEFTFPPEEEIEKVIKRFSDPNYRRVNKGLKSNATTEEKIKYELCQNISHNIQENDLAEKELGKKLGIDQIKVEYILFGHINKLSLKELTTYVDKLNIPVEIKINGREKNTP
jgi:predicted XRE-type DNA-binding protein